MKWVSLLFACSVVAAFGCCSSPYKQPTYFGNAYAAPAYPQPVAEPMAQPCVPCQPQVYQQPVCQPQVCQPNPCCY